MDYNRFFGNRRSRRRILRINHTGGEMVDLLQLMRRRLRYRPYAFRRFTIRLRERTNLASFNSHPREDLSLYNSTAYREMSNLSDSMERQDVSTNTEQPCCPASVLYRNQMQNIPSDINTEELEFSSETELQPIAANRSSVSQTDSVEIPTNKETPQSTVENVEKKDTVATTNTKEVKEVKSKDSNVASSSDNICSEDQDILKTFDSNTASTDVSSNIEREQSSHDSSLADVVETSEESLVPPPAPRIAYIEVHHNNDSSLSLETTHPSASTSTDAEAGGDGHHNDSVLQFKITLTTTVADVDTDNSHENDEQHDHDDENENDEPKINVSEDEEEHNRDDINKLN